MGVLDLIGRLAQGLAPRLVFVVLAIFAGTLAAAQDTSLSDVERAAVERRAVEAMVWGMPAANYDLMRQQMLDNTGAKANQVVYWGRPLDWMNQTLTPNPDTLYFMVFFETHDGPIVLDLPAANGGSFNGNIVTAWQAPIEDVGLLGVDKGAGGKFVLLPPGYKGGIPEGFTALQSETYGGFALIRSNLASHSDSDVAASVAYGKRMKVYPLSEVANPPPTVFVDASNVVFDSTIRYDSTFFENLNRVIQEEPWIDRDRSMIDMLATIGIVQGQPFKPDTEMRGLLNEAAVKGRAFLYETYDKGWSEFFAGTHWRAAAAPALAQAAGAGFMTPDAYPTDLRGAIYTVGYVGIKRLGTGQFYLITTSDAEGRPLDGASTYRLTVPQNVPVEQYWSATVYDRQTHALVRHMDHASRSSQRPDLVINADGSVDIWFGPEPPAGKEANWVPTDPLRDFEVMFRLYGPKPALFDKSWALPDITLAQ